MGQVETRGPDADRFLQRMLSNDIRRIPEGGAQYSVMCGEDGGVLDDLFTYRLASEHFLTVTNAANHERDFAWLGEHAGGFDVDVRDCADRYAMLAVQGPHARGLVQRLADGSLPPRMHCCLRAVAGVPMLVSGTGYTGEDGVELLLEPDAAETVWDAIVEGGAVPAGLGARDTLRLEVCFHLYGNDLSEDRGPIEAGLGWCCKEETGFIGADAVASRPPFAAAAAAGAVCDRGGGDRARRQPGRGRGRGHERQLFAVPETGDRDGVRFRPRPPSRARRSRSTSVGHPARRPLNESPCTERDPEMAQATYPDDLLYHSEHDWARLQGDEATFGITWYAQDALGEVVYFDLPKVGATVSRGEAYAEVESVKAVSDVYAPLSGEIVEINEALADEPETINDDPYGKGWLVRVKLSEPSEQESLMDAASYEASLT